MSAMVFQMGEQHMYINGNLSRFGTFAETLVPSAVPDEGCGGRGARSSIGHFGMYRS